MMNDCKIGTGDTKLTLESNNEEIANNFVTEVVSWSPPNPEPEKDTYRCDLCSFEILGEDNCVIHVIEEHDAEIQTELKEKLTKRTKQFQCVYHPEFETNSIDDFKVHLQSHQKITQSLKNIDEKIPEAFSESGLINKELLLN